MLSVVIVNYNAGGALAGAIAALLGTRSCVAIEIIVVDNASSDNSIGLLESSLTGLEPPLQIVRNQRNLGFAAACNIGLSQANGRWLLFLNPDCEVEEDAIEKLLNSFSLDPQIGMVGGLLLNADSSEQAGGRRSVPTPWRSFVRVFKLSPLLADRYPRLFTDFQMHLQPLPGDPIDVEAISGACMLIRREAIEDVGVLDEGYFIHCEDLDWCMRFRQKGWRIIFVPGARITHHKGTCSRSNPIFVEWHKHKGMIRFYRKFFYRQYPSILMLLVSMGVWLRFGAKSAYLCGHRLGRVIRRDRSPSKRERSL